MRRYEQPTESPKFEILVHMRENLAPCCRCRGDTRLGRSTDSVALPREGVESDDDPVWKEKGATLAPSERCEG